jgi:hypothetical protein
MTPESQDKTVASNRSLEIITAAILFTLGLVMIVDSRRVGMAWADDGPQSGYFPFYVGLILCTACVINLVAALRDKAASEQAFLTHSQFKMVMALLVPTTVFVIIIKWTGIYLASILLISWFMRRLGGFSYLKTLAVSLGVFLSLFVMFEIWFKVPLPKGPIEAALGFV